MHDLGDIVEPGGAELDTEFDAPCPDCGKPARHDLFERNDCGCINLYHTIDCPHCGHRSGFDDLIP